MRSPFLRAPLLIGLCLSVASAQQAQKPASPPSNKTEEQSSGTQAPGMRMPQPSPEMQRLVNSLSGTWSITEKYEPGEWMPGGGIGRGGEVCRAGPGGLSLIEDYHSKTPKGEFFGLSVSWWDEKAKGFRAVWCANTLPAGCIVMAKLAKWEGNQLVLGDEFERNGKKFTFKETLSDLTPNSYSQAQYEGESGAELKQLVTIHATRVASPTRANDLIPQLASQAAILKMPGPKVQNLMLGVWSIKIKYEPRAEMPKGDVGQGTEVWRPGPGGLSVIEEEHNKNTHGETDGFSVGWWDAKGQGQRFVWCANDIPEGCVVPKNVAKWESDRLVFSEEREEMGKKITEAEIFSDITPTSFTQLLQRGASGNTLKTFVSIRATKLPLVRSQAATQSSSAEADLRTAMAERRKANLEGDTDKIESLIADEYMQTDVLGRVQDRSAWLTEYFKPLAALIKAGKFRWEVYDEKDVHVRDLGDAAVAMGSLTLKGNGAKPTPQGWVASPESSAGGNLRFTHVWIKRNGKWLLAAVHNALLVKSEDMTPHPRKPEEDKKEQ